MRHLPFIVVISFLLSSTGLACLTLDRTIQLKDSPFFFQSFDITGFGFKVKTLDEEQTLTLSCKNEDGVNKWYVSGTQGQDPGEDAFKDIQMPDNQQIVDTEEVPQNTAFYPFLSSADGATVEVRSAASDKWFKITCKDDPGPLGTTSITVDMRDANKSYGEMTAVARKGVRSLGGGRADDHTIDFGSGQMSNLKMAGCGVDGQDFMKEAPRVYSPGVNQ